MSNDMYEMIASESMRHLPCGHCKNYTKTTANITLDDDGNLENINWMCQVCGSNLISHK